MPKILLNSHRFSVTVNNDDLAVVRMFQRDLGIHHTRAGRIVKTGMNQLAKIVKNNGLIGEWNDKLTEEQIGAIDFSSDREAAKTRSSSYTIRQLRREVGQLKDKIREMKRLSGALKFAANMGVAKQRPLSERKADAAKRGWKWDEENDRLCTNDDGSAILLEEE